VGSLARYGEIAVALGGGLTADGRPNAATLARADAAAALAKARDVAVIVSGSHGDGPRPERTEARHMADRLVSLGIAPGRIFVEDGSRDTLTNAAFVAERYLAALAPRPLIIVTQPFHMARAVTTFALVLGPRWPLEPYPATPGRRDADLAATEALYLARTRQRLEGIAPGDVRAIATRARETLPQNVSDAPRRGSPRSRA
jgi:uncharacterized SAM-binding protein YcdF (DUF218 family)